MGVVCHVVNVVAHPILVAVKSIIFTSCDVDGIRETILTQGIGKTPHRFLIARGDEVQAVAHASQRTAFHLAMQMEAWGEFAITDEHKLAEETTALLYHIILHRFTTRDTDDVHAIRHSHIPQAMVVVRHLNTLAHERTDIATISLKI